MARPLLCWLDLETTGLDPERDRILEAAIVLTDTDLYTVAQPVEFVIHRGPAALGLMCDAVRDMHTRTGLLDRVKASRLQPDVAYRQITDYVRDHTKGASKVYLAGSSVHFDRKFVAKWIPKLNEYLHYRHVDVSTLKSLADWWGFKAYKPTGTEHKAAHDIQNSIDELRFYRWNMLREL